MVQAGCSHRLFYSRNLSHEPTSCFASVTSFALIVVKISSFIPTHQFLAVYCLMELLRSIESSDEETLIKRKRKFKCFGAGKVLIALLIIIALLLTVYVSLIRASEERKLIGEARIFRERSNDSSSVCYFAREWNDGKTLSNVIEQSRLVTSPLNILFHETSCSDDGVIRLTSRQACAVESAGENPIIERKSFLATSR